MIYIVRVVSYGGMKMTTMTYFLKFYRGHPGQFEFENNFEFPIISGRLRFGRESDSKYQHSSTCSRCQCFGLGQGWGLQSWIPFKSSSGLLIIV